MSKHNLRRFVDSLLRGRKPAPFRPDEFEAEQMRIAVELRAARPGAGTADPAFVDDLRRQLATSLASDESQAEPTRLHLMTRRQALAGTSIAAASAAFVAVVDRTVLGGPEAAQVAEPVPTLSPTTGEWRPVAASDDIPRGATHAFDVGSLNGFVHRTEHGLHAVSGVCTHLGCKLWLDATAERLRCPCHSTSFKVDGELAAHQLPQAPPPLPAIQVRDHHGTVEVFVPAEQA